MTHRQRGRRPSTVTAGVAVGLALSLLLAACGSGGSSKTATKAGPTGPASSGQSPTSTAGASNSTPNAPAGLVVSTVLTTDLLRGAGLTATGIEDDGGASVSGEFISQAKTATANSDLTVVLTSFADPGSASSAYTSSVGATPTPIPGAGEKAALNGQTAYVLKGSQLLSVAGKLSPAAEAQAVQAKISGGSVPASIFAAAGSDAKATASALAAKLTGQSATKSYVALPKGAINPCFDASGLAALKVSGASAQNVPSESSPSQACDYSLGSAGTLHVETLTSTQTAAAVPATSLLQVFNARNVVGGSGSVLFNHGKFIGRDLSVPGDFDVVLYLDPPVASTLEIFEEPSGSFKPEDKCEEFVRYMLDGWLKEQDVDPLSPGFAQEYNDALKKLTDACHTATGQ